MVDLVLQGAWVLYPILSYPKMKSLPLLAFRRHVVNVISLKYSKEDRLCSSHVGTRIIPSDVCYDMTSILIGELVVRQKWDITGSGGGRGV